jgi:hypothetical protein
MGKTFRQASVIFYDINCNFRGFQKKDTRSLRHSIRNDNRNSDECTYVNYVKKKFWGNKDKYYGVAPNINGYLNDKSIEKEIYGKNTWFNINGLLSSKWNEGNTIENIKNNIKLRDDSVKNYSHGGNHNVINYLKCSLKQIERRGKAKIFKGHDRSLSFD